MEAVVFAAGRGSRLGALTETTPKALVEVAGRPLLAHVLRSLRAAGVEHAVVNTHHHASAIHRWVAGHPLEGLAVSLSHERERALETGGGLCQARAHLVGSGPLLLHNVDVLTSIDLRALRHAHVAAGADVTLLVAERASSRGLLFDEHGLLGRVNDTEDLRHTVRAAVGEVRRFAFQGVHCLARAALAWFPAPPQGEQPAVASILAPYLAAAAEGARIVPHFQGDGAWIDVGRPADLARARATWPSS